MISTTIQQQQRESSKATTTTTIRRCLLALLMSSLIAIYQIYFVVVESSTNINTSTTNSIVKNNNGRSSSRSLSFAYIDDDHKAIIPAPMMIHKDGRKNQNNNNNLSFCCLQQQQPSADNTRNNGNNNNHSCSDEKVCWKRRIRDEEEETNNNNPVENNNSKFLTVALMYYAEPAMLIRQLDHFITTYPQHLLDEFVLLIVDDGSPCDDDNYNNDPLSSSSSSLLCAKVYVNSYFASSKNEKKKQLDIRIARIEENIPWNTPGARNLAFKVATTSTVLMIDSDLLIPKETMQKAMTWQTKTTTKRQEDKMKTPNNRLGSPTSLSTKTTEIDDRQPVDDHPVVAVEYYNIGHQFNRTKPNGEYKTHPSAMLIDVSNFWDVGGFEEDLSGHYGYEDLAFWYRFTDKKINPYNLYMEHPEGMLIQYDESDPCSVDVLPSNLIESCRIGRSKLPITTKQKQINEAKFNTRRIKKKWSNLYLRFPWTYEIINQKHQ